MVRKMTLLVGLASALLATADVPAQDDIIADQFYGSGVHRYFSGDLRNAHADFTNAIQNGGADPRPYYFRGLAYLRMGRPYEASADFRKGADLESNDINGSFQVSKALERIQGGQRLQLERHRVQARAIAQQRQDKQRRERYAASRRFEAEQIQRAAAEQDVDAARPAPRPAAPDPFEEATEPGPLPGGRAVPFAGAPPADPPPAVRNTASPDPVTGPPAAAAAPADPFGAPLGAERTTVDTTTVIDATTTPAEKPADVGSDPFGSPATPDAGTPPATGTPAPTAPAETSNPFGETTTPPAAGTSAADMPADASDPFGSPTTPATGTPATATPADSSDPFGAPAAAPGTGASKDADPFGAPPATAGESTTESSYTVTADRPLGPMTPANNSAAPAAGNSTSPASGATGGFFRALGRAVGVDAARGVAESARNALPVGRGGAQKTMPARGGARANAPVISPPSGPNQPQMTPGQERDPFGTAPGPAAAPGTPAADPDDPFGPADAGPAPAQGTGPFGAPAAGGDDPFKDDAVQPSTPAAPSADPFGGQ
jgi:hypothetical protein